MNGAPLSSGHGAPLRLRNEVQLGCKQVQRIAGIELSRTSRRSAAATAATTRTTSSSATANPPEPAARRHRTTQPREADAQRTLIP
jgi:DMSO/TMAO reductase YedYZ molybdopterin-dependent catalytic subunit